MSQKHKHQVEMLSIPQTLHSEPLHMVRAEYCSEVFSKHVHEEYAICLIERGVQSYWHKGENCLAGSGDIAIVNPDEVHTGQSGKKGHSWQYLGIYPTEKHLQSIQQDLGIRTRGTPYFRNKVIQDNILALNLKRLFHVQGNRGSSLLTKETLVYHFLKTLLMDRGSSHVILPTSDSPKKLLQIRDYLNDCYDQEIGLEALAKQFDISKFRLLRDFKKQFGLAPHQYQIQRRLWIAKHELVAGKLPAHAAIQAGFYDQSHLHRHFTRAYGMTPHQYQQAAISYKP